MQSIKKRTQQAIKFLYAWGAHTVGQKRTGGAAQRSVAKPSIESANPRSQSPD